MGAVRELIAGVSGRWTRDAYDVIADLGDDREAITDEIVEAVRSGTSRALSLLPFASERDLWRVADAVMARFEEAADDRLAQGVLRGLAYEYPIALDPHLGELLARSIGAERSREAHRAAGTWDRRVDARDPGLPWLAWRGAGEAARYQAWACAESGDPVSRRLGLAALAGTNGAEVLASLPADFALPTETTPFARGDGRVLALSGPAFHLAFPRKYRRDSGGVHPTHAPAPRDGVRFGGAGTGACERCGEPRQHIIDVDRPFDHDGRVVLETCLTCAGWRTPVMYHRHDASGAVIGTDGVEDPEVEGIAAPLVAETTVGLRSFGARFVAQPHGVGNHCRIGGFPTWVRAAAYPDCVGCGRIMRFLAQLDSGLPTADGAQFDWGSGGVGYAFWCPACAISAWTFQAP